MHVEEFKIRWPVRGEYFSHELTWAGTYPERVKAIVVLPVRPVAQVREWSRLIVVWKAA